LVTSNPITVSGLAAGYSAPITVAGGDVSINGGAYASAGGFVQNGDVVRVRVMTTANYSTAVSAAVNIGGAVAATRASS
jgi:hypothetical protein